MEYLRDETIKTAIKLANRCYPPNENEGGWINPLDEEEIKKTFEPQPQYEELEKFIHALSDDEKAELMALMWLGRGGGEWENLLKEARGQIDGAAEYMAEKAPLAIYLKKGIERAKKMHLF